MVSKTDQQIIDELKTLVAGRGRGQFFWMSKYYAFPSPYCIDFSSWLLDKYINQDFNALVVFMAQTSFILPLSVNIDPNQSKEDFYLKNDHSFDQKKESFTRRLNSLLALKFHDYFLEEDDSAKADFIVALILVYHDINFAKIMMPYQIHFADAEYYADWYIKRYPDKQETKSLISILPELPLLLPKDTNFIEFQNELKKLPLTSRLHIFDVYKYSTFGKKPKLRLLNDMTLYDTRRKGIDEDESANILRECKLIKCYPDGYGEINPEYLDSVIKAIDYSIKVSPIYMGIDWKISMFIGDDNSRQILEDIEKKYPS